MGEDAVEVRVQWHGFASGRSGNLETRDCTCSSTSKRYQAATYGGHGTAARINGLAIHVLPRSSQRDELKTSRQIRISATKFSCFRMKDMSSNKLRKVSVDRDLEP